MKINKKLILTVLTAAVLIQLIIILYNQFTGYIQITGLLNFFIRLIIGSAFTFVFGLLIIFLDIQIINKLDRIFPLPKKIILRIPVEFILSVIAGVIVGTIVTLISDTLMPYEDGLLKNIINNTLITSVINIIIVLVIESILWFKRSQESLLIAEKLEKENTVIRFETLKSQLNPHFLFNSLNVLSSLIKKEPVKAQTFVDEFSSVYRYTLDVIDKQVVELNEEIDFAKSFLYLQKIRFGDAVKTEINVDASKLNYFVPSLAVQTLLENAFKHNRASDNNPLNIKIFSEDGYLVVTNNLQPKLKLSESKGIGLSNLTKRYELISEQSPEFSLTEKEYVAKIPLIKPE